jgi:hypothetical protein
MLTRNEATPGAATTMTMLYAAYIELSASGADELPEPAPHATCSMAGGGGSTTAVDLSEQHGSDAASQRCELRSLQVDVARDGLEPLGAVARLPLRQEQYHLMALPVGLERRLDVLVLVQAGGQPDRVLQGQLGAGPDVELVVWAHSMMQVQRSLLRP